MKSTTDFLTSQCVLVRDLAEQCVLREDSVSQQLKAFRVSGGFGGGFNNLKLCIKVAFYATKECVK